MKLILLLSVSFFISFSINTKMAGISLASFVPVYPISPTTDDITKRLEFNMHWANRGDYETPGDYFKHQKIVITYLLAYDRIFLFHKPGTGKSRSFIGAAEAIKKATAEGRSSIKKFIILTDLQDNIRDEIISCGGNSQQYEIIGYITFEKMLEKIKDITKTRDYDDTFFIIDEAHNLRTKDQDYIISKLFDHAKRTKICVATATPFFNFAEDCIPILNFLLPPGKKLVSDDLHDTKSGLAFDKMKSKIGNIVSFVGDLDVGLNANFVTNPDVRKLETNPAVYELELSDIQLSELKKYNKPESFAIGGKSKTRKRIEFSAVGNGDYTFENLGAVSPKCHLILSKLLQTNSGKCFAFSTDILNGIVDVLGKVLEANGFSLATGIPTDKKPRYAFYTGEQDKGGQRLSSLKAFNVSKNLHGDYIKILIASGVGSEGISLTNVKTVFCLTGEWNFARTYQGIYRAIRATSHEELFLESGRRNFDIDVYLLCAVHPKGDQTLDTKMYTTSEEKDHEDRRIQRILKRLAFDCELNYNRNVKLGLKDGSRECDYDDCNYVCDYTGKKEFNNSTIGEKLIGGKSLVTSEFDILFSGDHQDYIIEELREKIIDQGIISLADVYRRYRNFKLDDMVISGAIEKLLLNKFYPIIDKFGFDKYIGYYSNQLVLLDSTLDASENVRKTFTTNFYFTNLSVAKIELPKLQDQPGSSAIKTELAKAINKQSYDYSTLDKYKAYYFEITNDQYNQILAHVNRPTQGKKSKSGIPTDKKILSAEIPPYTKPTFDNDNKIIFTNVFILSLLDHVGSKTGLVSEFNNSGFGDVEGVEYYSGDVVGGWETDNIKSRILRNVIAKWNYDRLTKAFEEISLNGGPKGKEMFSLYPDDVLRMHHLDAKGEITSGLAIANINQIPRLILDDLSIDAETWTLPSFTNSLLRIEKVYKYESWGL